MVNAKMKTLYFVPEFPRLTETFIEREISKLVEFGNLDLTVFSLQKASGTTSEQVEKIVIYKRLDVFNFLKAVFYFIFKYPEKLKKAYVLVVSETDKVSKFERLKLFIKSIGYSYIFKQLNPDHIHSHFLSWPSTMCLAASILLDKPFSVSAHAKDVFVDGSLISVKAKNAKFISVCNGNTWKKCVEIAGEENSRNIFKIFHGFDEEKAFLGKPKMKKPNRPMIFVGSRLVEKKGLKYVIEASKILKERGVNHEIHIVGPGPMYKELIDYVKACGVEDRVFIPGEGKGLPFLENVEYFKVADIFVHPSIQTSEGDVDGVPTFIIEAALAKLPIVTTKVGSIQDLITDENGILIPDKDSFSLATAIERLIYNLELRKSLGQKAYERAKELFNLDKNVKELEGLFLK